MYGYIMGNTRNTDNNSKEVLQKGAQIGSVKSLILEMGILLSDTGHVWTNSMRTAFNKAIKKLEHKDVLITS